MCRLLMLNVLKTASWEPTVEMGLFKKSMRVAMMETSETEMNVRLPAGNSES